MENSFWDLEIEGDHKFFNYIKNIDEYWIHFKDMKISDIHIDRLSKRHTYKIHIIIPKYDKTNYYDCILKIMKIFFHKNLRMFKIDRTFYKEKEGSRAFTVYFPDYYLKSLTLVHIFWEKQFLNAMMIWDFLQQKIQLTSEERV